MTEPNTVFDAVLAALAGAAQTYNRQEEVAPRVVLWPDKDGQWQALEPRLRAALPHFYTLSNFAPDQRRGPAIWLRYILDGQEAPQTETPVFYLPGVSRSELRAVETCPRPLQPLAELQYRGVFFSHVNGKDWTVASFMQSTQNGGLGLDVARDAATQSAMGRALVKLADVAVAGLRGRQLTASDFDDLLNADLPARVLTWLNAPHAMRAAWPADEWGAFRSQCQSRLAFDPDVQDALEGAQRLGEQAGAWALVWRRFVEAPRKYPGVRALLEQARPMQLLLNAQVWPQDNAQAESALRDALLPTQHDAPAAARLRVLSLEQSHGVRRNYVWAELGESPLAVALAHLAALAHATASPLGGDTLEACARAYAEAGWQADAAATDALASMRESKAAELAVVKAVVMALYKPWLQAGAEHFQALAQQSAWPRPQLAEPQDGACILFADGLRLDVAHKLADRLQSKHGLSTRLTWRLAALPTLTATAKPAVSPIAPDLSLDSAISEFYPTVSATGKPLTADAFRKLLGARKVQVLMGDDCGDSSDPQSRAAWGEYRDLDTVGHSDGFKLAWRIDEHVRGLAEHIAGLLQADWREVTVVTDHGWLLLPEPLPKQSLPPYLAPEKGRRCALLAEGAIPDTPVVAWHWNPAVRVAVASGISVFAAPVEYSHGGLSPQECVIPILTVSGQAELRTAKIASVKWVGLRCRVTTSGAGQGLSVDVRARANDAASSHVAQTKVLDNAGNAAVIVTDDTLEGTSAFVVLVNESGEVVARQQTVIGE